MLSSTYKRQDACYRSSELHAEAAEPPYGGPGLKPLATSKKHVALTPVADRAALSSGVRGNGRAAVPLASEGGSQLSVRSVRRTLEPARKLCISTHAT